MNIKTNKKAMYIIDPEYLYSINEIGNDIENGGLCLIPSKSKEGLFMANRSIRTEVKLGKIKPYIEKKSRKGESRTFRYFKGEEIIRYIKEELPKSKWHKYMK